MNITHASTKADIIDASCEVIDTQAEQINDLNEPFDLPQALPGAEGHDGVASPSGLSVDVVAAASQRA